MLSRVDASQSDPELETIVESHSVLGTLWAGLGMGAYYIALIWINTLLAAFLTPLFIIPGTWLLDVWYRKRQRTAAEEAAGVRA